MYILDQFIKYCRTGDHAKVRRYVRFVYKIWLSSDCAPGLLEACEHNDIETVKIILKYVPILHTYKRGQNNSVYKAIKLAAERGYIEIIKLLSTQNIRHITGSFMIDAAVQSENLEVVKLIATLFRSDYIHFPTYLRAYNHPEITSYLNQLCRQSDHDELMQQCIAARSGNIDGVTWRSMRFILEDALDTKNVAVIQKIIDLPIFDFSHEIVCYFPQICKLHDMDLIRYVIRKWGNLIRFEYFSARIDLDLFQYILTICETDLKNYVAKNTLIIQACRYNRLDFMVYYFDLFQNETVEDCAVYFQTACINGFIDIVTYLLDTYKVTPNTNVDFGTHIPIVKLLLERGADPSIVKKYMVRILLEMGMPPAWFITHYQKLQPSVRIECRKIIETRSKIHKVLLTHTPLSPDAMKLVLDMIEYVPLI